MSFCTRISAFSILKSRHYVYKMTFPKYFLKTLKTNHSILITVSQITDNLKSSRRRETWDAISIFECLKIFDMTPKKLRYIIARTSSWNGSVYKIFLAHDFLEVRMTIEKRASIWTFFAQLPRSWYTIYATPAVFKSKETPMKATACLAHERNVKKVMTWRNGASWREPKT